MMLRKRSMGLGDAYYCDTSILGTAELQAYGLFNYTNCPTAYCAANPSDPLCTPAAAPTGISPGLPVGYNSSTGTVSPTNTSGAVTTPTQTGQASALATALNPVIGNDSNVSSKLGGAGDSSDPNAPCPLQCAWFNIGCPTACDPTTISTSSIVMWAGGALLVLFVALKAIK